MQHAVVHVESSSIGLEVISLEFLYYMHVTVLLMIWCAHAQWPTGPVIN